MAAPPSTTCAPAAQPTLQHPVVQPQLPVAQPQPQLPVAQLSHPVVQAHRPVAQPQRVLARPILSAPVPIPKPISQQSHLPAPYTTPYSASAAKPLVQVPDLTPTPSPTTQSPVHPQLIPAVQTVAQCPSALSATYWVRLDTLVTEACVAAADLLPPPSTPSSSSAATFYQGKPISALPTPPEPSTLATATFYGVQPQTAYWAATRLAQQISSRVLPTVPEVPLQIGTPTPDTAVEQVRVHVWEAELTLLPSEIAEQVVTARRIMRRFRTRIELCMKILCALEGRGRRLAAASLDRAKLALQKADLAASAELERFNAARERARKKKEKKREKGEKKKVSMVGKKRARLGDAKAASFMMRFVKRKVEPSKVKVEEKAVDVGDGVEVCGILPLVPDRDVVSVAWWLLSQIPMVVGTATRDAVLDPICVLHQHLEKCAAKRVDTQRTLHSVLRNYRRGRTVHLDDRAPRFSAKRADLRGRGDSGAPVKLLQFEEDVRPAFFGTFRKRAKCVRARRPFGREEGLDYSYDSAEEWEEEEDGEDLLDVEADNERANEDAELRKLYGSDEEDDDDFLDDGDVEDDEEGDDSDGADTEAEDATKTDEASEKPGVITGSPGGPKAVADPAVIDLTKKKLSSPRRKSASDDAKALRKRKRRNRQLRQTVVIQNVSLTGAAEPSPLDRYAVTALDGAPTILMFNPYITHVSDFLQETSPPKPAPARIPRTSLDEGAKLDLAAALVNASSRTSRDSIVFAFCESRRARGLPIPPKSEIVRAIRVIGTNEKRKGDTRAGWYLNDAALAAKLREIQTVQGVTCVATGNGVVQGKVGDVVEACSTALVERAQ